MDYDFWAVIFEDEDGVLIYAPFEQFGLYMMLAILAWKSVAPPAPYGIINNTGLSGYSAFTAPDISNEISN